MRSETMQERQHYKQVIVVRQDLDMSPGKLAAQVSHASMAFLTNALRQGARRLDATTVRCTCDFDYDMWTEWIGGIFTKVTLRAKTKGELLKVIRKAEEAGMAEGRDFFCIRDACLTELEPEEDGTCLTCIGFAPMPDSRIDPVTKRLRLYS